MSHTATIAARPAFGRELSLDRAPTPAHAPAMRLSCSRFLLWLFGVVLFTALPKARAADDQTASIESALSRYVVSPATFGRKVLYTWTRPDQIAELRAGKALLSRRVSTSGEPSRFDLILADKAKSSSPPSPTARALPSWGKPRGSP